MRTHRRLDQAIGLGFLAGAAYVRQPASVRLALAAFGAFSVAAASLTPDRPVPSTRQLGLARTAVVPHRRSLISAEVARGVAYQRLGIVNVAFLGEPGGPWVLVDAGLKGTERLILAAAKERFGSVPPDAIILTHGHFDHVGALRSLAEEWDVPIYAHAAEFPYLTGVASYPPADPDAGGGLMTSLSPLYPTAPIDITDRLRALPENGALPGAPDWRVIHTPGHTPGHVSLWRDSDRVLLAGDAIITTRQESALSVVRQTPELHGPPAYFTPDWFAAGTSVRVLGELYPDIILAGHGQPVRGDRMRLMLRQLAEGFEAIAVPAHRIPRTVIVS